MSLDGCIAREDGREDWLPSAGWDEFLNDAKAFGNIVMGRETYELVTRLYPDYNFDDVDTACKVIVTRNEKFVALQGYSVVHSPEQALAYLAEQGFTAVLLIGGGNLNTAFLQRGLIDEVWLTIVPHLLGQGRRVVVDANLDVPLTFMDYEQLSLGRFRARYWVNKS